MRTHLPMTSPTDAITVELVDGTKVVVPDSLELITSYAVSYTHLTLPTILRV